MVKRVMIIAQSSNARGGINSVVKAYSKTEFWNRWQCLWIETHIDKNFLYKLFFFIRSLSQFILKIPSYSIVHIHLSEPPSAFRKYFFLKIAKLLNKNVIAHFHSFSIETTIEGNHQNLYHNFFVASDKIIVLSNRWKIWILEKWPELSEKVEVLYNPSPVVNLESHQIKTKSILFAGTLNSRKGYADLIYGFAHIADKYKEWKLVFAGNGEIEKARELATALNIKDQVLFKGWVVGDEKDKVFKSACIFCLPSYAEGFPMAILDAWAYGLPVITTLVGGLPDIVIDCENALVIMPGDVKGISNAIESLITNEKLRQQLSKESLKLSRTIFSLTEITQNLDKIYSSFI